MRRPRAIVTSASTAIALAVLAGIVHSTTADNNATTYPEGLMGLVSTSIVGQYSDTNDTIMYNVSTTPTPTDPIIVQLRVVLEGGVIAVIANIGVFGNLLSMYILLRKKLDLQPFLCRLLILLVVFDTIFLVAEFSLYSLPELNDFYREHHYPRLAPKLLIPLSQIALTGSVYSIVGITVERYICCCFPHISPREGPAANLFAIGGIILFSVLFNITRFFEYETVHEVEEAYSDDLVNEGEHYIVNFYVDATRLRGNRDYIRYYLSLAGASVMVLIPLGSLILLNWRIHRAIKQQQAFRASLQGATNTVRRVNGEVAPSTHTTTTDNSRPVAGGGRGRSGLTTESGDQRREVTISQILVIIVVVFLVTQSFKVIVVSYEVFNHLTDDNSPFPAWIEILIPLNHVALATNAALNIVIYICKDKKFRKACIELLCPMWLRRKDFWCVKRSNNGSDTSASDISERLQEIGDNGRRGTRVIMLPSDKTSSGVSTSRSQLTPRRDVIVDMISNGGGDGGRGILNSGAAPSSIQLTERRACDSSFDAATFNSEMKERETSLQDLGDEKEVEEHLLRQQSSPLA